MIRIPKCWPVVFSIIVLGCGRERAREAGMPNGDSLKTGAESVSTAPATPTDTMTHDTGTRAQPQESGNVEPRQQAAPPRAVATRKPRPNIDPRPTNTPQVPKSAVQRQPQDTDTTKAGGQNQPLRDPYHQAPRDTVSQPVYNGWKQFNLNCARCHGEDVLGTTIAPHLIMSLKPNGPINTKEIFIQTVCNGRPAKGMPAWCTLGLDTAKIEQIYSYVKGRSDAKIGPGRPAVRQ